MKALVGLAALLFATSVFAQSAATEGRYQATGASKTADSNGLQARWNGQRDQALGRRLHGRRGT
jgi:hypothetical protein